MRHAERIALLADALGAVERARLLVMSCERVEGNDGSVLFVPDAAGAGARALDDALQAILATFQVIEKFHREHGTP